MLLPLGLLVLLTTVLCELAARKGWLPYWVSRKILHVVAVGSCAVAGYYADRLGHRQLLTWIVAVAEVALLGLIGFGGLMREESGRKPWGIVWFPLAFLLMLIFIPHAEMIGFCMAVLAICDPAATIAGKLYQKGYKPEETAHLDGHLVAAPASPWYAYNLTGDPKTLIGSGAFFLSFLALCYLFPVIEVIPVIYEEEVTELLDYLYLYEDVYSPYFLVSVGLILTIGEALGTRGSDNLIVPLLACFFMALVGDGFKNHYPAAYWPPLLVLLSAVFAFITVKRKMLTYGGAFTAAILGTVIFFAAGPGKLLPLLLFFASSSLIGRLTRDSSVEGDSKHQQPRDSIQVLANGGVYGALCICVAYAAKYDPLPVDDFDGFTVLLLITAAVANADTWSSELGQYFRQPTYDLLKWRRVPAGLSGGVSAAGTLAGVVGAGVIAVLGYWLLNEPDHGTILTITGVGFLGMLLDSVLGSLLQATYQDPATGQRSDVEHPGFVLVSGFPWMTNDLVNFLAILLTVGGAYVFG